MELVRKPLQGVNNIIRFNWHFYVIALGMIVLLFGLAFFSDILFANYFYLIAGVLFGTIAISLLVSFYIYDVSNLYQFPWMVANGMESNIININAGFDETSGILQNKFPRAHLIALDFYNPAKHTEVSIKRARKAYPASPGTIQIKTTNINLPDDFADKIYVIFSAHEIRNEAERISFFLELKRILKHNGQIYITEHLRDLPNFMAYNIGFMHFYSKATWRNTFRKANLIIKQEIKLTPFISTFILEKNGNTH